MAFVTSLEHVRLIRVRAEGQQEGRAEGVQEGSGLGQSKLLSAQITATFSMLPGWAVGG